MKKVWMGILLVVLLSGCGKGADFETMSDAYLQPEKPKAREVSMDLSAEAVAAAMAGEHGSLYLCDGYTVAVQTMEAGNLDATVFAITGYTKDRLQLIQRQEKDYIRYECVWTAAGEAGDQVGRAVILDDGNYHYTLSVMANAELAGTLAETWQPLLQSFDLKEDAVSRK